MIAVLITILFSYLLIALIAHKMLNRTIPSYTIQYVGMLVVMGLVHTAFGMSIAYVAYKTLYHI